MSTQKHHSVGWIFLVATVCIYLSLTQIACTPRVDDCWNVCSLKCLFVMVDYINESSTFLQKNEPPTVEIGKHTEI